MTASTAHATSAKPTRPQAILEVVDAWDLPSGLRRVVLGGDGFAEYQDNAFTDRYVKFLFADESLEPPYDLDHFRQNTPELLPTRRTYTVRHVDHEARHLTIDFVVHGDEGVAGPWARAATAGERAVITGAGGKYAPDPDADWHLFVGDMAALPAISQSLERLPEDARCHVVFHGPSDIDLGLKLTRQTVVHRVDGEAAGDEATTAPLLEAVEALEWAEGYPQCFVHGERGSMKLLRQHLLTERHVPRELLSLSAYWAKGRTEDRFQAEKREPIGQLDRDVEAPRPS